MTPRFRTDSPVPWLTRDEYEATMKRALNGDRAALLALFFQPSDRRNP